MDKEKLREIFGEFGDRKEILEKMFGSSFLDYRDESDKLSKELQLLADSGDLEIYNISALIGRSVENAKEVTCQENQEILLGYLKGFMDGNVDTTFEEVWAVKKHMATCTNRKCERLDFISQLDKFTSPEEMKLSYGKEIEDWES